MKIILCHNFYQQPGGEDQVFAQEAALLESKGNMVVRFIVHNDSIKGLNNLILAQKTFWNGDSYRALREMIREERPDVVHFHNTFPLISPSAYYAAAAERVPVVQTIHNFRLVCANAYLMRENRVCEDCIGRFFPWPGILHACYHGSRAASSVLVGMIAFNRFLGSWKHKVNRFIALTEFARQKMIQGGLPEAKIMVKPNFVLPDPGMLSGPGEYFLFAGRLSPEKGIRTLLEAWEQVQDIPLKIFGSGPMEDEVARFVENHPGVCVEFLGQMPREKVLHAMQGARALVLPSLWYEMAPVVIMEAFACGIPVIGSRLGGIREMVTEERTGLLFQADDPHALAAQARRLWKNAKLAKKLGRQARCEYETKYTAEDNYSRLMAIYQSAGVEKVH